MRKFVDELWRFLMANKPFIFRFGDVEVREREFSLVKAGEVPPVEPKAFRVLLLLLRNPQKLIAKEELLNAVWGDVAVGEGSLTRCIGFCAMCWEMTSEAALYRDRGHGWLSVGLQVGCF